MTFYTDDEVHIAHVDTTGNWIIMLNGVGVRLAKKEATLRNFVLNNSVPWERPLS